MAKSMVKVRVKHSGFDTRRMLKRSEDIDFDMLCELYAKRGVEALKKATPVDSGLTADSWYYELEKQDAGLIVIRWLNSNVQNGINIALILHMGHGTGTGGWVEGRNYITEALQPLIDELADVCFCEVIGE